MGNWSMKDLARGANLILVGLCLLLAHVSIAPASGGFTLSFQSPAVKVFLDEPSSGARDAWQVDMARGESESFQLLVHSRGKKLSDVVVEATLPTLASGTKGRASVQVEVHLVGYVESRPDDSRPWGAATKVGWWPDPLLPNRPFDVEAGETQPVWITLLAPLGTAPGAYVGALSVKSNSGQVERRTYRIRVYDAELPKKQQLRNATFMPAGTLSAHYQVPGGLWGQSFHQLYERWARFAFEHHLGPAFDMVTGWNQIAVREQTEAGSLGPTRDMLASGAGRDDPVTWPVRKAPGGYDFQTATKLIDLGREYSLDRFCIAMLDREHPWEQQSEEARSHMANLLRAYLAALRSRGLAEGAFVYNVDEPGKEMWDTVKKNYQYIHSVDPGLKVWLCLNEVTGVNALAGYTDIWDVYIRQYEESGVEKRRRAGDPVMWGLCVWPHEHPNLFIEYPATDARIVGWLTYVYGVSGFEYWGLNQWGVNTGRQDWAAFDRGSTRTRWQRTRWPLGDGWLLYPGPQGEPLSSVRFENLRDGFEDAELLLQLASKGKEADAKSIALKVARTTQDFTSNPVDIEAAREALLKALVVANGE